MFRILPSGLGNGNIRMMELGYCGKNLDAQEVFSNFQQIFLFAVRQFSIVQVDKHNILVVFVEKK